MPKRTRQDPATETLPDPLLITPAEACRLLGCSLRHLYTLGKDGLVDIVYLDATGKKTPHRRVVMKSLRAYVESLPQDKPGAA